MKYSEKLKDPRWQKKRLEIFERDEWACQRCGDDTETLNVHHLLYQKGKEPWDYEDKLLITLCSSCHETETMERRAAEQILLDVLSLKGFFSDSLMQIAIGFLEMKIPRAVDTQNIGFVLNYILQTPGVMTKLEVEYFTLVAQGSQVVDGLCCDPKKYGFKLRE